MSSQPMQESLEIRFRRMASKNQSLRERLQRCQWYLEAVGEAVTLETAKEMAAIGLLKSLCPAEEGENG